MNFKTQRGQKLRRRPRTPSQEGLPLGQYEKQRMAYEVERQKEMKQAMESKVWALVACSQLHVLWNSFLCGFICRQIVVFTMVYGKLFKLLVFEWACAVIIYTKCSVECFLCFDVLFAVYRQVKTVKCTKLLFFPVLYYQISERFIFIG